MDVRVAGLIVLGAAGCYLPLRRHGGMDGGEDVQAVDADVLEVATDHTVVPSDAPHDAADAGPDRAAPDCGVVEATLPDETMLAAVNSDLQGPFAHVAVSPDGAWLVLDNDNPGTIPDLFIATRAGDGGPFGSPTRLQISVSGAADRQPAIAPDGTLFFSSTRPRPDGSRGSSDIYAATWTGSGYTNAQLVESISTIRGDEFDPYVTAAGIFFVVSGTNTRGELNYSIRYARSTGSPLQFDALVTLDLGENLHNVDGEPAYSAALGGLVFKSNRNAGQNDLWFAPLEADEVSGFRVSATPYPVAGLATTEFERDLSFLDDGQRAFLARGGESPRIFETTLTRCR